MKYPCKSPYLSYYKLSRKDCIVTDILSSQTYRLSSFLCSFLQKLDGKHDPYELLPDYDRSSVRKFLGVLKEYELLAPAKKLQTYGFGSCTLPLFYCYPGKTARRFGRLWNSLLMLLFTPMLVWGVILLLSGAVSVCLPTKGELFLYTAISAGITLITHELSHACACLGYGGQLCEVGIGLRSCLPMAYVFMDTGRIKNPFRQFQADAAGIEMNLLLFGVFMTLAKAGFIDSFLMYQTALINLFSAAFNALPFEGSDGFHILSRICGEENLLTSAKTMIRTRKVQLFDTPKPLRFAKLAGSYLLVGFQFIIPLLLLVELYCLVSTILFY